MTDYIRDLVEDGIEGGFTPDGRPFSVTEGPEPGDLWEDYKLLDEFSEEDQQKVLTWIREHITPRATENTSRTSYSLKHDFENDGGFYMTNNQFKDAMNQAGFMPVDETELNWTYQINILIDRKS